jgi:hypothetical protein
MKTVVTSILFVLVAFLSVGCGPHIVRGGDPHPTAVVPHGTFALELAPQVADQQEFDNIRMLDLRATLARGFYNAVGASGVDGGTAAPSAVLVIDECAFFIEHVGYVGVLSARVRGRWLAPDGTQVGSFAGRPVPRNGLASSGQRQLEDLIEVMYETLLHDFAQSQNNGTAVSTAGGEQNTTNPSMLGGIH